LIGRTYKDDADLWAITALAAGEMYIAESNGASTLPCVQQSDN